MVIMDREEYRWKMKLIKNDADKNQIINHDPTLKIEKKVTEPRKHTWRKDTLMTASVMP